MKSSPEYNAIRSIKNVGHAKRACAALLDIAVRTDRASKSSMIKNNGAEDRAASNFKKGGLAYYKDIALTYANFIFDVKCGQEQIHSPLSSYYCKFVQAKIDEQEIVQSSTVAAIKAAA